MKIETLEEWNDVGACCCPYPDHIPISIIGESRSGISFCFHQDMDYPTGTPIGYVPPFDLRSELTAYRTKTEVYHDRLIRKSDGVTTQNYTRTTVREFTYNDSTFECDSDVTTTESGDLPAFPPVDYVDTAETGTPGDSTVTMTNTFFGENATYERHVERSHAYSNFVSIADRYAFALSNLEAKAYTGPSQPISLMRFNDASALTLQAGRFRFRVPFYYFGNQMKVTWDVLSAPDDAPQSFLLSDQTWDWVGPGDQLEPDGESWLSPWYELELPTDPGQVRPVNVRYQSWSSAKVGTKPNITGEAVEL